MSAVGETGLPYRMSNATAFARDRVMSTRTISRAELAGRAHRTGGADCTGADDPYFTAIPPRSLPASKLSRVSRRSHDRT